MSTMALTLTPIPGFESTAYAYSGGRVVWAGRDAVTDHPRNAWTPWQPDTTRFDTQRLQAGAQKCLGFLGATPVPGLLLWLTGQALPFPLNHATARFDAIRAALERQDMHAFEAAAVRVLGLGNGLTPSGDDFVGGIFFAFAQTGNAQQTGQPPSWRTALPAVITRVRLAAKTATNPISAALLDDLMAGSSYRALHEVLAALHSGDAAVINAANARLFKVGASSGADMLAGLMLALLTLSPKH